MRRHDARELFPTRLLISPSRAATPRESSHGRFYEPLTGTMYQHDETTHRYLSKQRHVKGSSTSRIIYIQPIILPLANEITYIHREASHVNSQDHKILKTTSIYLC